MYEAQELSIILIYTLKNWLVTGIILFALQIHKSICDNFSSLISLICRLQQRLPTTHVRSVESNLNRGTDLFSSFSFKMSALLHIVSSSWASCSTSINSPTLVTELNFTNIWEQPVMLHLNLDDTWLSRCNKTNVGVEYTLGLFLLTSPRLILVPVHHW